MATKKNAKKYRVAIIGAGRIGAGYDGPGSPEILTHAHALATNPRTEFSALVDIDDKQGEREAKRWGVPFYADLGTMLAEVVPEIVILATPPQSRIPAIRACVKSGVKIIICEKPLAMSVREARAIEKLVGTDVTFVLNYQRRFSPLFKKMRDAIADGRLGRIQQVTCYYSNGIYNNGGHIVDALSYLLQDTPVSAIGIENRGNTAHHPGDSNIDGLLKTKKGTTVTLQSLDQGSYGIHDIELFGTKGSLLITDYGQRAVWIGTRPSKFAGITELDHDRLKTQMQPFSATKDTLAHAIESFEGKKKPASGTGNGIEVLQVLEALEKSAKSGGKAVLL